MLTIGERRRLVASLKQALAALHRHARAAAVARPSAALWQARFELRRGRPAVALRRLQAALRLAQKLAQPLDEGLAHYWLARTIARQLFTRLGAVWHAEQVEAALRSLPPPEAAP